ncbi:MAG TPA: hypothetical protein VMV90_03880 [Rectinemataceae bacterium]|nr:hypothetical protein [Rectinemataceae bacterium]
MTLRSSLARAAAYSLGFALLALFPPHIAAQDASQNAAQDAAATAAAPLVPLSEASFGSGAEYTRAHASGLFAAASGSTDCIGRIFALRLSGEGSGTAWSDGSLWGAAGAEAQASASFGRTIVAAGLHGGLANDDEGRNWNAALRGTIGFEGFSVSTYFTPRFVYDSSDDGGAELGLGSALSILAGQTVLKPNLDLSAAQAPDGTRSLSLRPGLGLSWYPGLPLALSGETGFTRSWYPGGGMSDEVSAGAELYGALGDTVLFRAKAWAAVETAGLVLDRSAGSAELSFLVAALRSGELRAPVRVSWDSDPDRGPRLYAGLRFSTK